MELPSKFSYQLWHQTSLVYLHLCHLLNFREICFSFHILSFALKIWTFYLMLLVRPIAHYMLHLESHPNISIKEFVLIVQVAGCCY